MYFGFVREQIGSYQFSSMKMLRNSIFMHGDLGFGFIREQTGSYQFSSMKMLRNSIFMHGDLGFLGAHDAFGL
jgi:hypothetical protein